MSEEDLAAAFKAGRLTRRAFVRQLVERGMPMTDALAFAESLVPEARPAAPAPPDLPAQALPPEGPARLADGAKPTQIPGLEIGFLGDGYVVLHPAEERMHSLNHTAALVLELCTGENDSSEIARLLQNAFGLSEPPLDETRMCLETLFRESLIR